MADAGYVTAAKAASAMGLSRPGSVHRLIQRGKLRGCRAQAHWYVSVRSLLDAHADAPPIYRRILALGVTPKDDADIPASKRTRARK